MADLVEQKGGVAEIALSILCIVYVLLVFLASSGARMDLILVVWFYSTVISWICNSLAFYILGVSHPSSEGFSNDRSASLACSALLFVGLANSIVCCRIPDAYQNLCASYQQLVQMVFVLLLIISPWSIGPSLPIGLLLAALFLLWVAQRRSRLLSQSARSRIKDDLLISEYMAKKHGDNQVQSPGDLSGCNYVVGGEVSSTTYWALQSVFLKHLTSFGKEVRRLAGKNIPALLGAFFHDLQYASTPGAMASSVIRYDKLVTVQDIWKHIPPQSIRRKTLDHRDFCLSFALFKLLRRRFRGCDLHESGLAVTKNFAVNGLLYDPPLPSYSKTASSPRAFGIIEAEMGFLFDFFYGNHMPDFCHRLATLGFMVCTVSIFLVYRDKLRGEHEAQGIHVITSAASIFFMFLFLGICQLFQAVLSGWQKVNLLMYICQRRKRSSLSQGSTFGAVSYRIILNVLMLFPYRTTRTSSSHRARQYCLLLHGDSPRFTTRKIPIKAKGALVNALLDALRHRDGVLSDGQSSLLKIEQHAMLSWACRQEFLAEKIIVWHIATTLCHVGYGTKMDEDHEVATMLSAYRAYLVGYGTTMDEDHEVATMLSGYCAYLVGFAPELIADDIYATRLVFDNARAAASERVKGEGSLAKMCESAKRMTFGGSGTDFAAATKLDVIFQGKMLAAQLLNLQDDALRWRVLAEFWAELMLFISPTDNAAAHLDKLKTGGEFITHIWALLKHAGILERPSGQLHHNAAYQKSQLPDPSDLQEHLV